eukprot:GHVU01060055.1.p4 GENE.GHVU01060055.1~~GHVU01060055.1.p4  ORF type:complete len:109 (-),score=16.31 GHVU01060055.1:419-745(-)
MAELRAAIRQAQQKADNPRSDPHLRPQPTSPSLDLLMQIIIYKGQEETNAEIHKNEIEMNAEMPRSEIEMNAEMPSGAVEMNAGGRCNLHHVRQMHTERATVAANSLS